MVRIFLSFRFCILVTSPYCYLPSIEYVICKSERVCAVVAQSVRRREEQDSFHFAIYPDLNESMSSLATTTTSVGNIYHALRPPLFADALVMRSCDGAPHIRALDCWEIHDSFVLDDSSAGKLGGIAGR